MDNKVQHRVTLRRLFVRRIFGAVLLMMMGLTTIFGVVSHRQLHEHIDAMLLEVAIMEAKLNQAEEGPIHLHSSPFMLPGSKKSIIRRGLVYDERCQILTSSWKLKTKQMPSTWCVPEQTHLSKVDFLTLDGQELRAASTTIFLEGQGKQHTFVVGLDHHVIDSAIARLILLGSIPSLLFTVLFWLLVMGLVGKLTRELEELTATCQGIDVNQPETWHVPSWEASSTREIRVLSGTISQLTERLQRSMQTQARFMAEAAHELRTPLTAMRGEIEVTLRRPRSPAEYQESLALILQDIQRMHTLSEQLLSAVRTGQEAKAQLGPCGIEALVFDALDPLWSKLNEADIQVEIDLKDHRVMADAQASHRVIQNIVTNTLMHAGATKLKLYTIEQDEHIELMIEDDGCGLSEELVEVLFQPFQRGNQRGHGLGLYIAYRLMKSQRGHLSTQPNARGARWVVQWSRESAS